jgi:hypothetical protein
MYPEVLIHNSSQIVMDSTAHIGKNNKLPIENINERHP